MGRTGLLMPREYHRRPLDQRLREQMEINDAGCWIWTGSRTVYGYGQMSDPRVGRPVHAHRLSYECFVGPIPDGHDIHHVCRVRPCINPAHLEAVSHGDHAEEHAEATRKSVCPKCGGSDFLVRSDKSLRCRPCHTAKEHERRAKRLLA